MTPWNTGAMPATAMAAAHAALGETELIAARKRGNAERRADLMRFFDAHGFRYTPSVANHLMVDARMPTPAGDRGARSSRTSTSAAHGPSGRRTSASRSAAPRTWSASRALSSPSRRPGNERNRAVARVGTAGSWTAAGAAPTRMNHRYLVRMAQRRSVFRASSRAPTEPNPAERRYYRCMVGGRTLEGFEITLRPRGGERYAGARVPLRLALRMGGW